MSAPTENLKVNNDLSLSLPQKVVSACAGSLVTSLIGLYKKYSFNYLLFSLIFIRRFYVKVTLQFCRPKFISPFIVTPLDVVKTRLQTGVVWVDSRNGNAGGNIYSNWRWHSTEPAAASIGKDTFRSCCREVFFSAGSPLVWPEVEYCSKGPSGFSQCMETIIKPHQNSSQSEIFKGTWVRSHYFLLFYLFFILFFL